jgi:hypothetical protein
MASDEFEYDVALSFAGEDRAVAREFANLLMNKNIKVFYDEDEADDLWGKDLIAHLASLYQNKARYCVMFISKNYPLKRWTNFERQHIQARAFRDTNEYILPIRIDDTDVPGITEAIGYRDIRQHSLESIANTLGKKLAKVKGQPATSSPSQIARPDRQETVHPSFGTIPMPKRKKEFTQFQKDIFAKESFNFIKEYFQQALSQLKAQNSDAQTDFTQVNNLEFIAKIYLHEAVKCQCAIWLGDTLMPSTIYYNEGTQRSGHSSFNDYLTVEDNGEELRLRISGMAIGMLIEEHLVTKEKAAEYL